MRGRNRFGGNRTGGDRTGEDSMAEDEREGIALFLVVVCQVSFISKASYTLELIVQENGDAAILTDTVLVTKGLRGILKVAHSTKRKKFERINISSKNVNL